MFRLKFYFEQLEKVIYIFIILVTMYYFSIKAELGLFFNLNKKKNNFRNN